MQGSSSISADDTILTPLGPVQVERRDCPACGADGQAAAAGRYSRPPWAIKKCPGCGFVYLDPVPCYEALNKTLSWDRSHAAEKKRRSQTRPVEQKISRAARKPTRALGRRDIAGWIVRHAPPGGILDIGCADGGRAIRLPEGYVPYGIEISEELARRAHQRFKPLGGRCVHAPGLPGLAQFKSEFFAGAMLRSYLEHEVQPAEVLAELARTLVPGGVAIVKVPNFSCLNRRLSGRAWCGFRFPDHVNYFTPASLRRMAARAGFTTTYGPLGAVPTSDNMWAVLRKP